MAQWNLSVDLRGQGNSLARTLRDNARHARTLATAARSAQNEVRGLGTASQTAAGRLARTATQSGRLSRQLRQLAADAERAEARLRRIRGDVRVQVRLDDQTAAGAAAIRARLAALSGGNVNLTANLHSGNTAAAAAAFRAADNAAQDLARTLRTLRGRAAASAAALDDLRTSALAAATGIRSLNTATRTADSRLDTLSTRTRTLRTDMDDLDGSLTRVTGRMGGLRGSLGTVSTAAGRMGGRNRLLIQGAVALATALIPIAAATVPIAAGMAAAGVSAGAFGVAIAGQIKHLVDATEAETAYQDAVEEHGRGSKEAATAQLAYARQMQKLPAPTREAAAAFLVLKDNYKGWSDGLAGDTMPVATKSFAVFSRLLEDSTPLAKTFGGELDRTVTIIAGGLQTEQWQQFMGDLDEFAGETLAKANHGLVQFTTGMDTGEIGGNLREFMAYARENAPLVGDTLKELASALMHLLVAASDVGVGVLQAVNALAQLVNAVPTGVLTTFLQLYAVMKLVSLGAAGLAAVTGPAAAGRLAAYFAVMRAAGVAPTLRATAASMSATTKAAIGLGVLAVAAIGIGKLAEKARGAPPDVDRLTTSLKNLAESGKFTGELKKTFGDVDGVVKKIGDLGDATKKQQEYLDDFGAKGVPVLEDLRRGANNLWQDFTEGDKSLSALKDDFTGLDAAMAGMVGSGYGKQAAVDFDLISDAAIKAGYSTKEVADLFPKYKDAVAAAKAEQLLAVEAMGIFGAQAQATGAKLDAQKVSADGLRQAILNLNDTNRAAYDTQIAFEQSIDDLSAAFAKNGATLDLNTEKGRANGTAMSGAAKAHDEMIAAGVAAGDSLGSMTAKSDTLRASMMRLATEAFDGNKQKATEYVNTLLGVPGEIETLVKLERQEAITGLQAVQAEITKTPGAKTVTVSTLNAAAIAALEAVGLKTRTLPDGRTEVYTANGAALGSIGAVNQAMNNLDGKTASTYINSYYTSIYRVKKLNPGDAGYGVVSPSMGGATGGLVPGGLRKFATGGSIAGEVLEGPGTTTSDSLIARLSRGEFVMRAAAVSKYGPDFMQAVNEGSLPGFASGGGIDFSYSAPSLYNLSSIASDSNDKNGKFSLDLFSKKLISSTRVARAWRKDLATVAGRAGQDVADALEAMGTEGIELTRKMATGSSKYTRQMAASLKALAETSKATLGDYTGQLTKTVKDQTAFQANLVKLAAAGNTDLAKALAEQGDQAAADLAAAAVKDPKRARHANTAARNAANTLSPEQVQQLVAIIAAVKTSTTGLHAVADATGLGEDDIIATATKATGQIKSSLGSRATKFLADLARAQKGLSYANGGIRPGIYSTQGGAVTFAEPETGGEAFIPLGSNKRRVANTVLHDVARRFGVGLTDISASRQVVVVKDGDTNVNVTAVRTGATASDIGAQVGRGVRRAKRGGVNARA